MIFDARWGVITENMRLFLVGRYPPDEIWRVWLALTVFSLATGLSAGAVDQWCGAHAGDDAHRPASSCSLP